MTTLILNGAEANAFLSKFTSSYIESLKSPVYLGNHGYASDGRIAIKVGVLSVEDSPDTKNAANIDAFMDAFDGAEPMPAAFAECVADKGLREKFDERVREAVEQSKSELESVTVEKCPHCGEPIWIRDGEVLSEKTMEQMSEDATPEVARRDTSMPVVFELDSERQFIIGYRYAIMLVEACGIDGEYRVGTLCGSREAVWGRSKDGSVQCVLMQMRAHTELGEDVPRVKLYENGGAA